MRKKSYGIVIAMAIIVTVSGCNKAQNNQSKSTEAALESEPFANEEVFLKDAEEVETGELETEKSQTEEITDSTESYVESIQAETKENVTSEVSSYGMKEDSTETTAAQTTEPAPEHPTEQTIEPALEPTIKQKTEQSTGQTPVAENGVSVKKEETFTAYSPENVVALATAKCQAGGMITTEDNLAKNLAEGKITQEEYNAYYPLDGMENSYYSVFVQTNLNTASTTSGRRLTTEEAIAQYIADMLLLEKDPVFAIRYAGIYHGQNEDFYEFQCHR